jgi:hypothetical protein
MVYREFVGRHCLFLCPRVPEMIEISVEVFVCSVVALLGCLSVTLCTMAGWKRALRDTKKVMDLLKCAHEREEEWIRLFSARMERCAQLLYLLAQAKGKL